MKKINVVGTSGSGKSTFSRRLSEKLGCPHIEMDALFWQPDWKGAEDEKLFADLENSLNTDMWVLDGNYSRTEHIKWKDADTVIWIDYSFARTLFHAVRRAFSRAWTKDELWPGTGNTESFRASFFSRESIILWTVKTYRKNRKRYMELFRSEEHRHMKFYRITSPKMARFFIENIEKNE